MPPQKDLDPELRLFKDLLIAIWNHQPKPWLLTRGNVKDIYQAVASTYNSLSSVEELENSLPSQDRVSAGFAGNRFLYFPPVQTGTTLLPILKIGKCDFSRSIPEIRLRLGLFFKHGVDTRAIGYRLESPEGPGSHHYYHVQMIRGFDKHSNFNDDEYLNWMPDQAPTFPLDVDSPVKLLLSLLIGLYGLVDAGTMLGHNGLTSRAKPYLDKMRCFSMPPIEWYWRVLKSGAAAYEFYRTQKEPAQVRRDFKQYAGSKLESITEGLYREQPKKNQRLHA